MHKPTVTSVYLMHLTLFVHIGQNNYNLRITLFLVKNFLMDGSHVTHCNIGHSMGKFWMLPIITLAHETVKIF